MARLTRIKANLCNGGLAKCWGVPLVGTASMVIIYLEIAKALQGEVESGSRDVVVTDG